MASYNQYIQRGTSFPDNPGAGAANLIPVDQAEPIMAAAMRGSAALQLFTHVPMSHLQSRVPVLSMLPQASFVNGEVTPGTYATGLKSTTAVNWEGRYLQAEEIATIVPIPENLLADTEYDLIGNTTPLLAEAVARCLDGAIFFGVNKPSSWPTPIVDQAVTVGNVVQLGTASQANGSLAADIANLFAPIDDQGFDMSGVVARTQMKSKVRNARTTFGEQLSEINTNDWYGHPVTYAMRGLWGNFSIPTFTGNTTSGSAVITTIPSTANLQPGDEVTGAGVPTGTTIKTVDSATQVTLDANATATATGVTFNSYGPMAIAGDMSQGIVGVRSDIGYKILTEATLTDASGAIQFNLAQQDAIAIRVVARFAFQVANPATYDQPNEAARWPFSVLVG